MKNALIFVSITSILISCFPSKNSIRGINFRENLTSRLYPQAHNLTKGKFYYYYKDYAVFVLDKVMTYEEFLTDTSGYTFPISEMRMEIKYVYYVCKKDQAVCIKYENVTDTAGEKMNKDSIISKYGVRTSEFLRSGKFTLVSTDSLTAETILKKYKRIQKENFTDCDSIYCYFSKKLNNIPFTYSKELDSITGLKLFKRELIYDELYRKVPNDSIEIPRIVAEEMKEINVNNKDSIIALCKRFELDIAR
jgi:hypothetical protein